MQLRLQQVQLRLYLLQYSGLLHKTWPLQMQHVVLVVAEVTEMVRELGWNHVTPPAELQLMRPSLPLNCTLPQQIGYFCMYQKVAVKVAWKLPLQVSPYYLKQWN